jgi:hypothetical protein
MRSDPVSRRSVHAAVAIYQSARPVSDREVDGQDCDTVSIFDLTKVSAHYGEKIPPAPPELDQDGDGAITILGLNLVIRVFARQIEDCPGSGSV